MRTNSFSRTKKRERLPKSVLCMLEKHAVRSAIQVQVCHILEPMLLQQLHQVKECLPRKQEFQDMYIQVNNC
jgi:hypothetical protein